MINDFDRLLQQCKTRAIKRVMRMTLRIIGSLALVGAGIFGYLQYRASTAPVVLVKTPKPIVQAALMEENKSTPSAPVAIVVQTPAVTVAATSSIQPSPAAVLPKPAKISSPSIEPVSVTSSNHILEVSTASNHAMNPEQMYQRAPKFETALGIARDFYAKEDYTQAAFWAKKANQMNREAEEAWLLYAKSYYAQGKKNEAIGVLELYLNYKDSKAATELIKSWR